jgi:quercetin dioxygenase-like cupin family protein
MLRLSGLIAILAVVAGCGKVAEEAPTTAVPREETTVDSTATSPRSASVALENEWVRAQLITLEPGSELPRHEGGDRVVYSLADYTIEWAEGEEAPVETSWTKGQVHWHAGGPHAVRNTGSSVAEFLVVERRDAPLAAGSQTAGESEAVPSDPEHGRTLLENEAVRVAEMTLEPGQSTGRHRGGPRVVFALTDYTIRWTQGDADPVGVSWSYGDAHWHEPGDHEVENIGENAARFLVVTLLR